MCISKGLRAAIPLVNYLIIPALSGACPQYSDVGRTEVSLSLVYCLRLDSGAKESQHAVFRKRLCCSSAVSMFPRKQGMSLPYTYDFYNRGYDCLKYLSKCMRQFAQRLEIDGLNKKKVCTLNVHKGTDLTCIRNAC